MTFVLQHVVCLPCDESEESLHWNPLHIRSGAGSQIVNEDVTSVKSSLIGCEFAQP